jgi:hypothetical protein
MKPNTRKETKKLLPKTPTYKPLPQEEQKQVDNDLESAE